MRIISGKYKGKRITAPKNLPVRPTTDQAKESLFNILNNNFHLEGLKVLDLFSGTGNISYEFLSRNASEVISVDAHYGCVAFQKKMRDELKALNFTPYKNDVFKALKLLNKKFDIIFADPPYDLENIPEIANMVFENDLLSQEGWLIIEHPSEIQFHHPNKKDHRNYGRVNFTIFHF